MRGADREDQATRASARFDRGSKCHRGKLDSLTNRERAVLDLLAERYHQEEIARELVISPRTVGTHIQRILGKLGVRSRAEAVAVALRHR